MLNRTTMNSTRTEPIYIPPAGPSRARPPHVFEQMGEAAITRMIHDFYAELAQSSIRALFPSEADALHAAAERSAAFFVGLLGGPPLYHMRHGNPMMRARHMPFVIDEAARLEWMACFDRVLADAPQRYAFPADDLPAFRAFLDGFSRWMVNAA